MSIGDHIRALKGGRWLHGIDGGDHTVIYFSAGVNNGIPAFRRLRLAEFANGAEQVQVVTHAERVFPPRMVVARAFSRLRESAFGQMFSDSEQFAAWCKSGRLRPAARPNVVMARATMKTQALPATERRTAKSKLARTKARAAPVAKPAAPKSRKAKQRATATPPARRRPKAKLPAKAAPTKKATPKRAGAKAIRARPKAKKRR